MLLEHSPSNFVEKGNQSLVHSRIEEIHVYYREFW